MTKEIREIENKINTLENEIDLTVWGKVYPREDGIVPSDFSYAEILYEEEVELDASLSDRLERAREIQSEIRELKSTLADVREQVDYENSQIVEDD